jgi:hypothetical protein
MEPLPPKIYSLMPGVKQQERPPSPCSIFIIRSFPLPSYPGAQQDDLEEANYRGFRYRR